MFIKDAATTPLGHWMKKGMVTGGGAGLEKVLDACCFSVCEQRIQG